MLLTEVAPKTKSTHRDFDTEQLITAFDTQTEKTLFEEPKEKNGKNEWHETSNQLIKKFSKPDD